MINQSIFSFSTNPIITSHLLFHPMRLLNTFSMASLLLGAVYSHPHADAYADASPYAYPNAYPDAYADAYADAYTDPFFYAAPQAYRLQRRTDYTMPSSGSLTIKCPDGVTTLTIRGTAGAKFTFSDVRRSIYTICGGSTLTDKQNRADSPDRVATSSRFSYVALVSGHYRRFEEANEKTQGSCDHQNPDVSKVEGKSSSSRKGSSSGKGGRRN